jgi:hypothetical protein
MQHRSRGPTHRPSSQRSPGTGPALDIDAWPDGGIGLEAQPVPEFCLPHENQGQGTSSSPSRSGAGSGLPRACRGPGGGFVHDDDRLALVDGGSQRDFAMELPIGVAPEALGLTPRLLEERLGGWPGAG